MGQVFLEWSIVGTGLFRVVYCRSLQLLRESLHQEHDLRVGSGVVVVMGLNVAGGV
jgi:hypothetical protein